MNNCSPEGAGKRPGRYFYANGVASLSPALAHCAYAEEKKLSKATGKRVMARPIVALPGWVELKTNNSDVKVLSGKQVAGFIAKEPAKLSEGAIKRISYQLEQRCRDVEV